MRSRFLAASVLLICSAGCGGSSSTSTSVNSPTAVVPFSQLDLVVGTGAVVTTGSRVIVSYGGWLYDATQPNAKGRQFDASTGFTFTLGAGQVIRGWDQGVVGMRVGGQRRLIIPPDLAYGSQGVPGAIPANATLVFDIALLGVG